MLGGLSIEGVAAERLGSLPAVPEGGDPRDYPVERMPLDTRVAPDPNAVDWINPRLRPGKVRRLMSGVPGKTSVVYTLDRETGEFLWATPRPSPRTPSPTSTGAAGPSARTGEVTFSALGQEMLVCATWAGGRGWQSGAYSRLTRVMYFPMHDACAGMLSTRGQRPAQLCAGRPARARARHRPAGHGVSVQTGATTWVYGQRAATWSLVATVGELVFGGDVNARFRVLDHETGAVLWEINLGLAGHGLPGQLRRWRPPLRRRQHRQRRPVVHLAPDTPELRPRAGNNLFVYALP